MPSSPLLFCNLRRLVLMDVTVAVLSRTSSEVELAKDSIAFSNSSVNKSLSSWERADKSVSASSTIPSKYNGRMGLEVGTALGTMLVEGKLDG